MVSRPSADKFSDVVQFIGSSICLRLLEIALECIGEAAGAADNPKQISEYNCSLIEWQPDFEHLLLLFAIGFVFGFAIGLLTTLNGFLKTIALQ